MRHGKQGYLDTYQINLSVTIMYNGFLWNVEQSNNAFEEELC